MRPERHIKQFHTRMLINKPVIVVCRSPLKYAGIMVEYFERNDTIVLKDFVEYRMNEDKTWDKRDEGDLIIVRGNVWGEIQAKKFTLI